MIVLTNFKVQSKLLSMVRRWCDHVSTNIRRKGIPPSTFCRMGNEILVFIRKPVKRSHKLTSYRAVCSEKAIRNKL